MNAVLQPRHIQAADEMAMGGMESVVQALRATNAEQRVRIEKLQEMLHETQRLAANLGSQVRELKGENATAQDGSHIARVILGDCYALVEYDHVAAEAPNYNVESPTCGPGRDESIIPLNVFLNGYWCDIDDVRAALDAGRLVERIADGRTA